MRNEKPITYMKWDKEKKEFKVKYLKETPKEMIEKLSKMFPTEE